MVLPPAGRVLDVWEAGAGRSFAWRSAALLALILPYSSLAELLAVPVGQRDRMLLELRAALFGNKLSAYEVCPHCKESLDVQFDIQEILSGAAVNQSSGVSAMDEEKQVALDWEERRLRFRLPNTGDLIELSGVTDGTQARQILLQRCFLRQDNQPTGETINIEHFPAEVQAKISSLMREADPLAEIWLALVCPSCNQHWKVSLDITSYLWTEIDAWARRTLSQVHILAGNYGWSEQEVLALSPFRRQVYLDMIQGRAW